MAPEARTALFSRLSTALEPRLGTLAVWVQQQRLPCPHHGDLAPRLAKLHLPTDRCPLCQRPLTPAYTWVPVAWDDPAILIPRWDRWLADTVPHPHLAFDWSPQGHVARLDAVGSAPHLQMLDAWIAAWTAWLESAHPPARLAGLP